MTVRVTSPLSNEFPKLPCNTSASTVSATVLILFFCITAFIAIPAGTDLFEIVGISSTLNVSVPASRVFLCVAELLFPSALRFIRASSSNFMLVCLPMLFASSVCRNFRKSSFFFCLFRFLSVVSCCLTAAAATRNVLLCAANSIAIALQSLWSSRILRCICLASKLLSLMAMLSIMLSSLTFVVPKDLKVAAGASLVPESLTVPVGPLMPVIIHSGAPSKTDASADSTTI
mmetsp:Transcript_22809/g.35086  ORF Transcript_22809/g.35086 Transcript_22809/m.35086 type:complete len:231 (-) Transcript_22809:1419-2111(-)